MGVLKIVIVASSGLSFSQRPETTPVQTVDSPAKAAAKSSLTKGHIVGHSFGNGRPKSIESTWFVKAK
jgi:hypothetical protein